MFKEKQHQNLWWAAFVGGPKAIESRLTSWKKLGFLEELV